MKFQITKIEFDFESDGAIYITKHLQDELVTETLGQIWDVSDEEDLVDEVSCATGWCVKSIDYRHVLS